MSQKKVTCLIVEDDPAFVEIFKAILSKVKEVELIGTCDNTLDAAKRINFDKPDILLLDINISGLEGPEILEIADHRSKVIMISSHPEEVMKKYTIDYVEFIQKPLQSSEHLINAIHRCIELL